MTKAVALTLLCAACWLVPAGAAAVALVAGQADKPAAGTGAHEREASDLASMSLEELAALRVTVVAKRPQKQWEAPAAVRVLSGEEVARSGARSFAEALRFAPGVQVARVGASSWAVGVRGFASTLSRSLLVMIDGRSVYTPLFAGVYWDAQDALLADVDRIEVVRGPGGTLWGANAVNGVVDLVTKSAHDTRGLYVEAGGGFGDEQGFGALRYGGSLGEATDYRVYAKYTRRDAQFHADGSGYDAWWFAQGGFRADHGAGDSRDRLTLQGDGYVARAGQRKRVSSLDPPFATIVDGEAELDGGNARARWVRRLEGGSTIAVQAYYDGYSRREANLDESRATFDLDLQHSATLPLGNQLVWGVGYRVSADRTSGLPLPFFDPADRSLQLFTGFAQDELALARGRLRVTAGAKLEHNEYSGFEAQPSLRLIWEVRPRQRAWVAASRAVRTPSRADVDQIQTVYLQGEAPPLFVRAVGDKQFRAETAAVYEAGYRVQPAEWLALDAALFYDRYADLLGGRIGTPFVESAPAPVRVVIPDEFGNFLEGETHGAELAADVRPARWCRVWGGYSFLRIAVHPEAEIPRLTTDPSQGSSPRHQVYVRSSVDLPHRVSLDAALRYVSALPTQKVPSYTALDLRVAWQAARGLELSVAGRNLLDDHHPEFGTSGEIRRAGYAQASWRP